MFVMEVPTAAKADTTFERKVAAVNFSSPQDFPVALQVCAPNGFCTCGYLPALTQFAFCERW